MEWIQAEIDEHTCYIHVNNIVSFHHTFPQDDSQGMERLKIYADNTNIVYTFAGTTAHELWNQLATLMFDTP